MTRAIDYAPLSRATTAAEVRAWRDAARASGAPWATFATGQVVVLVIVVVVLGVVLVPFLGSLAVLVAQEAGGGFGVVPLVFLLGVLGLVAVGVVAAIRNGNGRWARWMRLDAFARANGMRFSPADRDPSYAGAIFQLGSDRTAVEHLTTTTGRFVDLGNFRYTTGSGKNRTTRTWGFVALELDRRLPHMVLDSRANNGLLGGTNLPASFDRDQVLSLEGDFDRYFTLYCPKEYERDALYVFTPDLMALLIDEAAPFDVEVIDDWMFVYSSTPFAIGQPAVYERLFRIVDTVGARTVSQTDRYHDERMPAAVDSVAPQGTRLKRRISVGALIAFVAFGVIWGWTFFGDLIEGFTP